MSSACSNVWIVVPALNEASVIGGVVSGVREVYRNVVVVDDCSSDSTGAAAAAAGAVVVRHPINLGQGAALQTGIDYALVRGADCVVTFDADGQHRVEDIAVLLATQRRTQADVVLGSRFLGSSEHMPALRWFTLKLATLFTRMASGLAVTDAHNGLRVFTRQAAERIRITQDRMSHASEIVHRIRELGLSMVEAPVTVLYTEYSLRKGQTLGNALHIMAELFAARFTK